LGGGQLGVHRRLGALPGAVVSWFSVWILALSRPVTAAGYWLLNHRGGYWGGAATGRIFNRSDFLPADGGAWWFLPSSVTRQSGSSLSFYQLLSNYGINILLFIYKKGQNDRQYNNVSAGNYAMEAAAGSYQKVRRVYQYYPSNGGNFESACPMGDFWVFA
jgi:hypothetical protein